MLLSGVAARSFEGNQNPARDNVKQVKKIANMNNCDSVQGDMMGPMTVN